MAISLFIKRRLVAIHRWVSLALLVFWFAQAGTGAAIVFHWELDDALIETSAPSLPVDIGALGAVIENLPPGWSFSSLWATGGTPGRFDISIEDAEQHLDETIRVTGNGTVLRRASGSTWIDQIVTFHQNMLVGSVGSTIVGLSGVVLAINIVMGVLLAWPGIKGLGRAVAPRTTVPPASTYARHRAIGLIVAVPALLLVSCGVLMVFEDSVREWLGAEPAPLSVPAATEPVRVTQILNIALARFPGAALTALTPPDTEKPYYVVRLRQSDEWRRAFGKTTLEIGPSGDILRVYEPGQGPWARGFMDNLFPLHTGEAGGLAGRLAVLLVGVALVTLIGFGARLWWLRRRPR